MIETFKIKKYVASFSKFIFILKIKDSFIIDFEKSINFAIHDVFQKILNTKIILNLKNIVNMNSQLLKIFFQKYKKFKKIQHNVNEIQISFIIIFDFNAKNYYIVFTLKVFIRMKFDTKYTALLNIETEINVMTKKMMMKKNLIMKSRFYMNFVSHIEHIKIFFEICENVEINIEDFKIKHHIFVISERNHILILNQLFMQKTRTNIE